MVRRRRRISIEDKISNLRQMEGKRFGEWTVLELLERNEQGQGFYRCRCSCGTERKVKGYYLQKGQSLYCGKPSRHGVSTKYELPSYQTELNPLNRPTNKPGEIPYSEEEHIKHHWFLGGAPNAKR